MGSNGFRSILQDAYDAWRIARIRAKENISLDSFADYLGKSQSTVSMWLNKKRSPDLESMQTIAPKLAQLLGDEIYVKLGLMPETETDPLLNFVNRNWDKLPPEAQEQIQQIIDNYLNHPGINPLGDTADE